MLRLVQKCTHIVKGLSSAQVELNDMREFVLNVVIFHYYLYYVNLFMCQFMWSHIK